MIMLRREINLFLIAILYYSRIQLPLKVDFSNENQSRAYRYFPLVGLIVGAIGGGFFIGFNALFNHNISVLLTMGLMILLTGALHEDGFADLCDGFGAGHDRESRLRIMKDSFLGLYAVVGVVVLLLLKFSALCSIQTAVLPYVIIVAQGVSRLIPLAVVRTMPYARVEKSKVPHANSGISWTSLCVASVVALLPLFGLGWVFGVPLLD